VEEEEQEQEQEEQRSLQLQRRRNKEVKTPSDQDWHQQTSLLTIDSRPPGNSGEVLFFYFNKSLYQKNGQNSKTNDSTR
jgi:hypothetical protein